MRNAIVVAVVALGLICGAEAKAPEIDLDKPGAMESLQRDHPAHYTKVMEAISKAQTIHVEPRPTTQNAGTSTDDPRTKDASTLMLSNPAKTRLVIPIDDVVYRVTAYLTKDPAKIEKAK